MLCRLPLTRAKITNEARPNGRAFALWGLLLVASGALALTDANPLAAGLSALLLAVSPTTLSGENRLFLALLAIVSFLFGPQVLLVAIPLALAQSGLGQPAVIGLGLLTSSALLYPQFQSLSVHGPLYMPLASFAFLVTTAWVPGLIFLRALSARAKLTYFLSPLCTALLLDMAAGNWIGPSLFTHPGWRCLFALIPTLLAAGLSNLRTSEVPALKLALIPALTGAIAVAFIPRAPISEVVFDESHGKWETVQSSFGPDDFGRAANYTYSQLFQKTKQLVGKSSMLESESDPLPDTDTLFVIKMPAEPLSEKFSLQVAEWVKQGGRLLLVGDHTDLYDTTQHANALLSPYFGLRINDDATYNPIGMPTLPTVPEAGAFLGRIDAHGRQFAWQTGASFQRLPLQGIELMTYGHSFAEAGDYSRTNRFGPFIPELSKRFFNHSAVVAVAHGRGAVAVLLDSTPWSNFSIFREQYTQMLRGLVCALEHPTQLFILSTVAMVLGLLAGLALLLPLHIVMPVSGLFVGVALSSGLAIGGVSWSKHQDERDFGLRVIAGPSARLEFLKQIIAPGERNYSRIVSAMGKYGLMPLASTPGTEIPSLDSAKRWLVIEPSPEQLPNYSDLLDHIRHGGDLVVMFAPEQATNPAVLAWLNEWGLITLRSNGLSVSDGIKNATGSFLGGRSPILSREIRVVTGAKGTSLLNGYAADQFLQTYTLRPTKLPRESGLFTVGFAAEQFSDDSVGEVWEGIYPSSLGRLRERQLASIFTGEDRPSLMPPTLIRAQRKPTNLPTFLVLENGEQRLTGKFEDPAEDDATTAYFRALRDQAADFIQKNCPSDGPGKMTQCRPRLLGEDMVEWLVNWRADSDGKWLVVELLHERRMSGLGSTWNVLFGK